MVGRRGNQAYAWRRMTGFGYPWIYFASRQVSAFSRLGSLRHLYLYFPGADQISGRHAKSAGSHLLDRRAPVCIQTFNLLPAFAAVGFAVQLVHSDGQRLMGFLGDGAIGHGSRLKPGDDRIHALHFVYRNPLLRILEFQLAAQIDVRAFLIHHIRIFLEHFIIAASGGLLQHMDSLRIVKVLFSAAFRLMLPDAVQGQIHFQPQRVKCLRMARHIVLGNLFDSDAADTAYGIGKIFIDKRFLQADRLKYFCSLIRLDGGYSHLGRNLYNTGKHRMVIIIHGRIVVLLKHIRINQLPDRLMGKIRVDRTSAVAQKGCKMMHFPWLSSLQNNGDGSPLLRPHQVLLQSRQCQQGWHGYMIFIHTPVREDQDISAFADCPVYLDEQVVDRFLQAGILVIDNGNLRYLESVCLHTLDL